MTRAELFEFIRRHKLAVVATTSEVGAPQAAVIGIALTGELELVFDTVETSRKALNLRRDPRVAFAIGWDEETVQCEGLADEPTGAELDRVKREYMQQFPDSLARQSWPGLTFFRVRLGWARYSDFRTPDWKIVEFKQEELRVRG